MPDPLINLLSEAKATPRALEVYLLCEKIKWLVDVILSNQPIATAQAQLAEYIRKLNELTALPRTGGFTKCPECGSDTFTGCPACEDYL